MKGVKRFAAIAAAAFAVCALSACGGGGEPEKKPEEGTGASLTDFRLTKEYMEGKSVVVYGDSITTANPSPAWLVTKNYITILSETLGFSLFGNFAVSGSALTHSVSNTPNNAAPEDKYSGGRYADDNAYLNSIADYAIVMYGANDLTLGARIGTNEDDPQTYDEITSYKGGIRYMVRSLRKENPDLKILFLTPLWRQRLGEPPQNYNTGLTVLDFGDALFDLAEELEYRVLDCFPAFSAETFVTGDTTADGVHPTDAGHVILAEYILEQEAR